MGEHPHPTDATTDDEDFRSFEVADGTVVIYDPENPEAWIRSDAFSETTV